MPSATYRLDAELKRSLERFCERHGLKQQAVVSEALATWLEDAEDVALIEQRREGPWVEWDDVRKRL